MDEALVGRSLEIVGQGAQALIEFAEEIDSRNAVIILFLIG